MVAERRLLGSIFFPSIATILLVSNVAAKARARLEEERRAADRLRLERDRAQEANALKGMVLGLVSHELVTPPRPPGDAPYLQPSAASRAVAFSSVIDRGLALAHRSRTVA